jgi:hypothetical protein
VTAQVPLTDRSGAVVGHALVDERDLPLVSGATWWLHGEGYAIARIKGRYVLMHRLILGLQPGDGVHTDHENPDRLDNRRENLRAGTQADNNRNLAPRKRDLPPGVNRFRGRFRAFIGKKYLGMFDTAEAAAETAQTARTERGW